MKTFLIFAASVWLSTPAHAVTFNCQGKNSTSGIVQLQCDDSACAINGALIDQTVSPQAVTFENCGGSRRSETAAQRYQTLAYYDVSDKQCWANYIRVSKTFNSADNTVDASIVQAGGGDKHDYSGYQYLYLTCKMQN